MFPLLAALVAPAHAIDADIVNAIRGGTVFLRAGSAQGSGFFLTADRIVTNRHVVEGVGLGGTVLVTLDSGLDAERQVPARVERLGDTDDLALLAVAPHPDRVLPVDTATPMETTGVVAAGFPLGDHRRLGPDQGPPVSLRTGSVTAIYREGGQVVLIEHNANMTSGNSGGPLLDEAGRVIGVNVAMHRGDPTTKLAIPAARLAAWVETPDAVARGGAEPDAAVAGRGAGSRAARSGSAMAQAEIGGGARRRGPTAEEGGAAAQAPAGGASVPVVHHPAAAAFGRGLVAEVAPAPDGALQVRFEDGTLGLFRADGRASKAPMKVSDLAVDDRTGATWAVEAGTGALLRLDDEGWTTVGESGNVQVAASGGVVWTLRTDGRVWVGDADGWRALGVRGTQEVYACGGKPLLRGGERLWGLDGDRLANGGEALMEGVRDVACHDGNTWVLTTQGQILDLTNERVADRGTDNVAIWAVPGGLLAQTQDDRLWLFDADARRWARVEAR